jgi:hypothetical protein
MDNNQSSPFLKELVSGEYAFFWRVYEGKLAVSQGKVVAPKVLIPFYYL